MIEGIISQQVSFIENSHRGLTMLGDQLVDLLPNGVPSVVFLIILNSLSQIISIGI